jgi:2-dehydro-3-deoxyglucarate aldolase/4-hydroxy-2-oxoheptanedioate aldolase
MQLPFRKRLLAGETLLGTLITLPVTDVVEIAADAGFDWLFIDLEHSAMDFRTAQQLVQTAAGRADCVIRCPAEEEVWIKKCLDLGPAGIIVPQVKNAEEVENAVRFSKYPPQGARSIGIARAQGYGLRFQEYVSSANEETALIIQIEHIDGVENIDAITGVSGIDAVFVGPYDLSGSIGKIGEVASAEVLAAVSRVTACCREKQIPLGIFAADAEGIRHYFTEGYNLLAVGIDATLLGRAYGELVQNARGLLGQGT